MMRGRERRGYHPDDYLRHQPRFQAGGIAGIDRLPDPNSQSIAASEQYKKLSVKTSNPETIDSRVYVGNLCKTRVQRFDIYVMFSKYGSITAISQPWSRSPRDPCSFAFVQYTTRDEAERAITFENGQEYYGYRLDVKLAGNNAKKPNARDRSPLTQGGVAPQPGPFNKREAANGLDDSILLAKRPRVEQECPKALSCAYCFEKAASPWQLILHAHHAHSIQIYNAPETSLE